MSLSFHFEPRPNDPNSLLDLFSQLNLGPPNNNNMASSSTPTASPREIKLNMPLPFSGKREDLTKFWQNCCVFTSINNKIYSSDKRKIAFILSLLTEEEVASWKEQFVGQAILNCKKQRMTLDFGTFTVMRRPSLRTQKTDFTLFLTVEMHYRTSTRGTRTLQHKYSTLQHSMACCEAQPQLDLPSSLC